MVKRRPLKCPVTTKRLSTNIILGAAMGRRKKKHRCGRSSRKLEVNHVLSDLGPSTSENSKRLSVGSSTYSSRRANSDKKDKPVGMKSLYGNGYPLRGVNDVFTDEIGQNGKVLSMDTETHKSPCSNSGEKLSDTGKSCGSKHNREHMENGCISISTRGLEETTGELLFAGAPSSTVTSLILALWDIAQCGFHPLTLLLEN